MNNRKSFYAVSFALILVAVLIVVKAVIVPQFFPAPAATQAVSDLAPEEYSVPYLEPASTPDEPEIKQSEMKVESDSTPAAQPAVIQQQVPLNSNSPVSTLELKGTVTGPVRMTSAIITDRATGSTGTYKIGDTVSGGRIVGIEKDGVLIDFDGQTIELEPDTPEPSMQHVERDV